MKKAIHTSLIMAMAATTLLSARSFAQEIKSPQSKEQYCSMAQNLQNFQALSMSSDNRMGFANYGGLMNGGVCWWHSMFQRQALYLTVFRPELPKPSSSDIKEIIDVIANRKHVVEIGGYKNLNEFTRDNEDAIEKKLESWQKMDGFVNQQWIVGLSGSAEVNGDKLKKMMDELYVTVHDKGLIAYQMLQIKGIESHAMLVNGMEKTSNGYKLSYIDSNAPTSNETYNYSYGDDDLRIYGGVVDYTQRQNDLKLMAVEVLRYCNPQAFKTRYMDILTQLSHMGGGKQTDIDHAMMLTRKGKYANFRTDLTLSDSEASGALFTKIMNEK